MCELKNGKDYSQEVRKEMGKLAARNGLSDRRAPDLENGEKYVTVTKFFMILGSVIGFLVMAFVATVYPDIRDMDEAFVPRIEEERRDAALRVFIEQEFRILREELKSRDAEHMRRVKDLESEHE